ncbi:hypothetical protein CLAFUW4_09451 [Fulvia fulva]|uniref:Uncharacterized protein n=1 Tax=Passalora fulva TaxID=5499 RepID=A0A9Q8PGT7_PASFU|nr:uncharacterized protein CLAFUR5_09548 [Fulvia fulva]KAK4613957.1 hypothetical protein CLAFUR4_09457 [Fulvia fulva]UJO22245.1 hypothetical protein CLAFUR5_09548 [Fulvia fulva]WPV20353.1 hypothetical protein CLAFUW4_09451 [Fulvia fulva]WPV35077.1 hypothetical protein CLAFUW7_09452 [Fulvia fulva]
MSILQLLITSLLPPLAFSSPHAKRVIPQNDFTCRSTTHPNPVVFFHGLGAIFHEDLNFLQLYLQSQGFCTFSTTYGEYDAFPFVGGLKPINASAAELATFIHEVQSKTGAGKIDLVGHSEGAFLTLYVPKFTDTAHLIDKIIAIAPPTHGTDFGSIYDLAYLFSNVSREVVGDVLQTVGCAACDELGPDGAAVKALTNGTSVQPGNQVTILTSRYDQLVTPTTTSWVDEPGVRNLYVQKFCPLDFVGHIGEAYDLNVWAIVRKTLTGLAEGKVGPDLCVTVPFWG